MLLGLYNSLPVLEGIILNEWSYYYLLITAVVAVLSINNQINISVENIDNVRYIFFIKLYIDSIFKMSFNDIKDIDLSICKSGKKK